MKVWKHKPGDSKRVKILKNCAAKLHEDLLSSASEPIKLLKEFRERLIAADIARLNARIKRAESKKAMLAQGELNFAKKQRTRKVRTRKIYVKVN